MSIIFIQDHYRNVNEGLLTGEKRMIDITMMKLGWYKETHTILGKKKVRWHRDGFELPEEFVKELLNTNNTDSKNKEDDKSGNIKN